MYTIIVIQLLYIYYIYTIIIVVQLLYLYIYIFIVPTSMSLTQFNWHLEKPEESLFMRLKDPLGNRSWRRNPCDAWKPFWWIDHQWPVLISLCNLYVIYVILYIVLYVIYVIYVTIYIYIYHYISLINLTCWWKNKKDWLHLIKPIL